MGQGEGCGGVSAVVLAWLRLAAVAVLVALVVLAARSLLTDLGL